MTPKIRVVNHRNDQGQIEVILFANYDTGMIVASVNKGAAQYGEDQATAETRFFLSNGDAITYVKKRLSCDYLNRGDVDYLVEEGSPLVQTAGRVPPRQRM